MKLQKKINSIVFICITALPVSAFEWPQSGVTSDALYSYFGQLRGGTISSSLIFSEPAETQVSDDGEIIGVISEHDNDQGWFESPLGNAVIVSHKNNMLSVYGNLDGETLPENLYTMNTVKAGTKLGMSSNSGWQEGKSCLEFQILDTKNKTAVNPQLLLPHPESEKEIYLYGLTAVNTDGTVFNLQTQRNLPSGLYRIYRERQNSSMPFKTKAAVNGAIVETITFDTLIQNSGRICAAGRSPYTVEQLYPTEKTQLIAETTLSYGRNILTVTVSDILGHEKAISYILTAK